MLGIILPHRNKINIYRKKVNGNGWELHMSIHYKTESANKNTTKDVSCQKYILPGYLLQKIKIREQTRSRDGFRLLHETCFYSEDFKKKKRKKKRKEKKVIN